MQNLRLKLQKGDWVAVAAVLLLAGLVFGLFLPKGDQTEVKAEIYRNGELVRTVSLREDQQLTVDGAYHNTITVSQGKIAITDSDCPGGDCVSCGWIGSGGRSIVCLPNGLEIRIVAADGDVDFVVG